MKDFDDMTTVHVTFVVELTGGPDPGGALFEVGDVVFVGWAD